MRVSNGDKERDGGVIKRDGDVAIWRVEAALQVCRNFSSFCGKQLLNEYGMIIFIL